jgi:amidase
MSFNSATEQLKLLRAGKTTSAGLVEAAIARIEQADASINAVVVRDFERARHEARVADQERSNGSERPLLGLPLTVKEAFDVQGLPTTWGLPGHHAAASTDAVLVERLRSAGAVIIGKTNVATMLADWQSANEVYGVTNNPWDLGRTSGGSSGGGAAAVASGMTTLDFGSDLAGSLRIPAAFCGVFAHRPSHGIVPMRGFAPPMAPRTALAQPMDQATVGPMARTAADLMLALDIVAGPEGPDAAGWRLSLPPARHASLADYRVLIVDEHPLVDTSSDIRRAIGVLTDRLRSEGCKVGRDTSQFPDLQDLTQTFSALLMSSMGVDMPAGDYASASAHAKETGRSEHERNMTMSHRDWMLLDRHRLELAARWTQTFGRWDVVVCPAAPTTAFRHDNRPFERRELNIDGATTGYDKTPLWAALAAPNGLPATTMPIGLDGDGLPVGLQIIGPRMEDYTPLAFATLLEQQLGYGFKRPVQN